MTSKKRVLAVALAGVLLLSSVASAGVVQSAAGNDSLTVSVENTGNNGASVTVTHNGSGVGNASVSVEGTNNSSYAGGGDYVTDENGTVSLPEPETDVTVEVTAEKDNATGATTATLTTADEEETDDGEADSFGQMVSAFVQEMLNAGDEGGPLGGAVSDFVTSNNPGADKKSDNAGKPDDAGKSDDAGKPNDAGPQNETAENSSEENGTDEGPPEDAGNEKDDKENDRGNGNDNDRGNGNGNDKGNGNGQNGDEAEEEETTTTEE